MAQKVKCSCGMSGKTILDHKMGCERVKHLKYTEDEVVHLLNRLYSAMTNDSTYSGVWLDKFIEKVLF